MKLTKEQAILVYEQCQISIKSLNMNLLNIYNSIDDESIKNDIRLQYAHSMANLIDVLEKYVYLDYPELRPY
ncbi:hypothetical protein [Moraxella sp. ZY210820]|uniref:hypothetical protein n=1 Tax=unclassified Moraxella TaxID=2685852 RepID=UPI00273151A2|nr:hypothetical protein [Moraxella sp. ZY210820]WLF84362.1 hypothetical protein LU301_02380 [Moraxella sp. ZY210820]